MAGRILTTKMLESLRMPVGAVIIRSVHGNSRIGNREVVGYGMNGMASYFDRSDIPAPAIRFKEETPDVKALREKEKGDWRQLSKEEKKALYRASFCQTYAEFQAPTGEWKGVLGWTLILISCASWIFILMKNTVYHPLPVTFSEESRKLQLKRMLDLHVNPIDGLASKWDYENNRWK